jgi:long-chain acyl-CoA synthetase
MKDLEFLMDVFREHAADDAVIFRDVTTTYQELVEACERAATDLETAGIRSGAVVGLQADYSPAGVSLLLAIVQAGAIVVPLSHSSAARHDQLLELAQAEHVVVVDEADAYRIESRSRVAEHDLYSRLRGLGHAGMVLFTSGYEGQPKGAVHDLSRLSMKYRARRHRLRTLMFLLFDHIGGIDTLFQALSNACAVVVPHDRTPEAVTVAIERHRVEVLPASPSFLTMLLLSDAHHRHDLSSLRYVTYGAEAMPQATLDRLASAFPGVTILQKYGLTELGTLRSRSEGNRSLWVKVGGEGFQTRVVNGLLQIKAESSMLGYLNAPSPITPDGWFMTGDAVEERGDYLRILGRASDLINVGGRKVYPPEIESVIQEVDNIAEAAVRGEPHPFTGQIVIARVSLHTPEEPASVQRRVRAHCRERLQPYQVPVRIELSAVPLHTDREKKKRG